MSPFRLRNLGFTLQDALRGRYFNIITMKVAIVLLLFLAIDVVLSNHGKHSSSPECRKAGVAQYVPSNTRDNGTGTVFIWGGKGNHRQSIFADAHMFDVSRAAWSTLKQHCRCPRQNMFSMPDCSVPSSRWKVFSYYVPGLGAALVFGGSTRPHAYFNDMWLAKLSTKRRRVIWEPALVKSKNDCIPVGRRAFGGSVIQEADAKPSLAIALGRDEK